MRHLSSFSVAALLFTFAFATPTNGLEPSSDALPIIKWDFDSPGTETSVGKVQWDRPGPIPPQFPDFQASNKSLSLTAPSYLRLAEDQRKQLQFDNGDALTCEAWVNLDSLRDHAYIIGKGRTESGKSNQNWAVRLRKQNGVACVNFLFRSRSDESSKGDWHRWTSANGFAIGSGWHHIAVSYRFGSPDSVRGFLDGKSVEGKWDMGGPTEKPPVVDDAEVWIGSAMAGNPGNSLDGKIDNLIVYRAEVPDRELRSRYRYERQPLVRPAVPPGVVRSQLFGPISNYSSIPDFVGESVLDWEQSHLALTRLPRKFDEWGVRDDWTDANRKSMLLRQWTDVTLEPGQYEFLIRSRGLSRLSIDNEEIASTPKQVNRSGAHHVVDPLPEIAVPGMRHAFMNDHEKVVTFHSDGGNHKILLESIIGGPKFRLEVGESCVAIARQGEMFQVLPSLEHPMTDEGWAALAQAQEREVGDLDRARRHAANQLQDGYWSRRHAYAREKLTQSSGSRSIDEVIESGINQHNTGQNNQDNSATTASDDFFDQQVQPIFQAHCIRCHGEKEQGGFSLLVRQRLLDGGESGDPAVVPGRPGDSYLFELISAGPEDQRMPPEGDGLSESEIETIQAWISDGAAMTTATTNEPIEATSLVDDATFLRRLFIDTVGVAPTPTEARAFYALPVDQRREKLIERLLADDRWADNWMGYWQDVFAENPNLLKPTLNNTGPFRFWIHDALVDNKPLDRFATELILMRGSKWDGGAAGFSVASQNDVPMAAKAHVIGTAFMGVEMKCARCHDAPYHAWKQSDLFQMAAMLERKPIELPESSTVPAAFFEEQQRKSLIEVTLKPGSTVHGDWPFADLSGELESELIQDPSDSREVLAVQVTASRRFAEVMANRIWTRLIGAGVIPSSEDWEGTTPSNPGLLSKLANLLIELQYDQREFAGAIFRSHAYQRVTATDPESKRLFAGPTQRRMTAEQIVDTACAAVGIELATEQLTLDVEGTLPPDKFMNFGFPKRAWEFSTLANERDRPSLALPKVQAITNVLKAFGWRNSRPEPVSQRDESPNLIQPGVLANGTLGIWLTRLADDHAITELALEAESTEAFVDDMFLRVLTRKPTNPERERFVRLLDVDFDQRITSLSHDSKPTQKKHRYVSWSNHLNTEANVIKVEMQAEVRRGPEPTQRLKADWRKRAEDALWALVNSPEMVLIP